MVSMKKSDLFDREKYYKKVRKLLRDMGQDVIDGKRKLEW